MKKSIILNIFTYILSIALVVGLSAFNFYISIYYNTPNPGTIYNIKPFYILGLIGIFVIIQYICIHKVFKKRQ